MKLVQILEHIKQSETLFQNIKKNKSNYNFSLSENISEIKKSSNFRIFKKIQM